MQQANYNLPAQHGLNHNSKNSNRPKPPQPHPAFLQQEQYCQQQGKDSQPTRHKTVRKLKKVPALQRAQRRHPRSVRLRPVRHRKRRVFRRHQRPRNKKQNRPAYGKNRKPVHTCVVSGCHSLKPNRGLYLESSQFCEIEPLLRSSFLADLTAPCLSERSRLTFSSVFVPRTRRPAQSRNLSSTSEPALDRWTCLGARCMSSPVIALRRIIATWIAANSQSLTASPPKSKPTSLKPPSNPPASTP